jgi:hypothetical protein
MSVEDNDIVSYVFLWRALSDACPKCKALNGRVLRDQDLFQAKLYDPIYGEIWDLNADYPLTHPNCRCHLEVIAEVDLSQAEWFQELLTATQKVDLK